MADLPPASTSSSEDLRRQPPVARHFDVRCEKGEFISAARAVGLRQDHGAAHGRRLRNGRPLRLDPRQRRATSPLSAPNQRNVGMVFQAYALFPNMNGRATTSPFGLKVAKRPLEREIAARVDEMLKLIEPADSMRSAIPTSSPAASSSASPWRAPWRWSPRCCCSTSRCRRSTPRSACRCASEIRDVQRKLGITTLFVTHDQEEALTMSDRIVVMNEGRHRAGRHALRDLQPAAHRCRRLLRRHAQPAGRQGRRCGGGTPQRRRPGDRRGRRPERRGGRRQGDRGAAPGRHPRCRRGGDQSNRLNGVIEDVGFQGAIVRMQVRCNGTMISLDSFNSPSAPPPAPGVPVTLSFSRDLQVLAEAPAV